MRARGARSARLSSGPSVSVRRIGVGIPVSNPYGQILAAGDVNGHLHVMRLAVVMLLRAGSRRHVADAVAAADVARHLSEVGDELLLVLRKVRDATRQLREPAQ